MTPEEKFIKACHQGLLAIVEAMVEEGFDPAFDNYWGFHSAWLSNHLAVMKYLYSVHGPFWIKKRGYFDILTYIEASSNLKDVSNWLKTLPRTPEDLKELNKK